VKTSPEELRAARLDLMQAQDLIKTLPEDQRKLGEELVGKIVAIVQEHGAIGVLAVSTAGLALQVAILEQGN